MLGHGGDQLRVAVHACPQRRVEDNAKRGAGECVAISASIETVDDPSARMINDYGTIVYHAISVVMPLGHAWRERIG